MSNDATQDPGRSGHLELVHADLSPTGAVNGEATPLAVVRSGCFYRNEQIEGTSGVTAIDLATITDMCGEVAQTLANDIGAMLSDPFFPRTFNGVAVTISVKEAGSPCGAEGPKA